MMKLALTILCLTACTVSALDWSYRRAMELRSTRTADQQVGMFGGRIVDISQRPYSVALQFKDHEAGEAGNGVLIDRSWVLTTGVNMYIVVMSNNTVRVATNNATKGGETFKVIKAVLHPDYKATWENDLALVKLNKPVTISKNVKPISIASKLPHFKEQTTASSYSVYNFTYSSDKLLREISVPFIPYKICKNNYKDISQFTSKSFCASTDQKRNALCYGDLGGPLVYKNELIGIFSGIEEFCSTVAHPAVYTDLTQYREWIKNTIAQ